MADFHLPLRTRKISREDCTPWIMMDSATQSVWALFRTETDSGKNGSPAQNVRYLTTWTESPNCSMSQFWLASVRTPPVGW